MVKVELYGNNFVARDIEGFKDNMGRLPTEWELMERRHSLECVNMEKIRDTIFPYDHETLEGYTVEAHQFTRVLDENLEKYDGDDLESFTLMVCRVATRLSGVELEPQFQ